MVPLEGVTMSHVTVGFSDVLNVPVPVTVTVWVNCVADGVDPT